MVRSLTVSALIALTLCFLPFVRRCTADESSSVAQGLTLPRGSLRAFDLEGTHHTLGDADSTKAVVVVFLATECPISNRCIPVLNQIAANPRKSGVEVYGVLSNPSVTRAQGRKHHKDYALKFPVLFDTSGDLRERLKATHTPHAFVICREGSVRYQGAVDNQFAALDAKKKEATRHFLTDAVASVVASRPVAVASARPVGCLLERAVTPDPQSRITFHRDVAPLLHKHCVRCHRPGQAAPFSLLTYQDAVAHANQIVAVTKSRLMPPWRAVHGFGEFKDERRLSDPELATLASWVEAGLPQGAEADAIPEPTFVDDWKLGKPDLVFKMPKPFAVRAGGSDFHQHFVFPISHQDARLISGVEFRPGNPRVVHHACFYLDNTGKGRKLDQADPGPGYGGAGGSGFAEFSALRSWLPGITPRRLPEGMGRAMPKGADLILELHYHPSGKEETDQSTVGIYFAPKKSRQIVSELQVLDFKLEIPAGAANHRHTSSYTLPANVVVLDCAPHMHTLGREMKAVATCPDGRVIPLIWVKNWNYLWQEQYEYREPIRLPKGTRIDVESWFDNSSANPLNPHSPPQNVDWGEQTDDEMAICHFQVTCDRMEDYLTLNRAYSEDCRNRLRDYRAFKEARARASSAAITSPPVSATAP